MSHYADEPRRRFFRRSGNSMLGGVCSGIADYFGFNLCATRFLAIVMFLMFMPMAVLAYIGVVLLVPSDKSAPPKREYDPGFRRAMRSDPASTLSDVKRRFQKLDTRLARLERYVTSPRFNLDQEFRDLGH